jgi:hypothetical protein
MCDLDRQFLYCGSHPLFCGCHSIALRDKSVRLGCQPPLQCCKPPFFRNESPGLGALHCRRWPSQD